MYEYRARLMRVVDGDTVDLQVDLGFHLKADLRFRVLGVDTPELRGGTKESKAKAREAKTMVEYLLQGAGSFNLLVKTQKADSFGRWLGQILYRGGLEGEWTDMTETLIEAGLGVPYEK